MINDEKIEESAKYYAEKNSMTIEDQMGDVYDAFKAGVKWATSEFLENLWHTYSEEPKERDKLLLVEIGKKEKQYVCFKRKQGIFGGSWRTYISLVDATRWAYLDDLFPKEGGEK